MKDLQLWAANKLREEERRVGIDQTVLTVRPMKDWGWWYEVGKLYRVRRSPFKATRHASVDICQCPECVNYRRGKKLYDMYETVEEEEHHGIIPVVVCEVVSI